MKMSIFDLNFNENGLNILRKKSFDGDEKAVELLLETTDDAQLSDAVYGYSYGGHVSPVEKILRQHPELSNIAMQGFTRANNESQIANLKSPENSRGFIAGLGEAGNEIEIKSALNSTNNQEYFPLIIEGLATTGQTRILRNLLTGTIYYPIALKAVAKSGHHELVNLLLKDLSIDLEKLSPASLPGLDVKRTLAYVLEGYAEGRHFAEAEKMINLGANPMICLNKLAPSGLLNEVDAQRLLLSMENPRTKERLASLMESQFNFNPGSLNLEIHPEEPLSLSLLETKLKNIIEINSHHSLNNSM